MKKKGLINNLFFKANKNNNNKMYIYTYLGIFIKNFKLDDAKTFIKIKPHKNFYINKDYINLIVRKTCTLKPREIQGKKFHN
jgi:hypothetical protein